MNAVMIAINQLINYALSHELIDLEHLELSKQKLIHLYQVDDFSFSKKDQSQDFFKILEVLINEGFQRKLFDLNTMDERDAFEAKIMDLVMPSPLEVKSVFHNKYLIKPELATDYLYKLSCDVNYIKTERLKENMHWVYQGKYGNLEMTINLAKPEKDPKEIAAALQKKVIHNPNKPQCVLCKENEQNYDNARMNLRIVPIHLGEELWHFQYSPYQYYHEHAIILHDQHRPMKIWHRTFEYLLDFIDMFPTYFIGSNADLPIVGGSILNHDHFQAGKHHFPIEKASMIKTYHTNHVTVDHINWPLSTIRLTSSSRIEVSKLACHLLDQWKNYENQALDIIPYSNEVPHQTMTPIARKINHLYQLDLVLRNNRTSELYPDGIFHPHPDVHHIKKENIGLIEAMGLAILPGRLKKELDLILQVLNQQITGDASLEKHLDWIQILKANKIKNQDELFMEVGKKFERVLEDSGVFKLDQRGIQAMDQFIIESIKTSEC